MTRRLSILGEDGSSSSRLEVGSPDRPSRRAAITTPGLSHVTVNDHTHLNIYLRYLSGKKKSRKQYKNPTATHKQVLEQNWRWSLRGFRIVVYKNRFARRVLPFLGELEGPLPL